MLGLETDELTNVTKSELIFIVSAWAKIILFWANKSKYSDWTLDKLRSVVNEIDDFSFSFSFILGFTEGSKLGSNVGFTEGSNILCIVGAIVGAIVLKIITESE